MSVLNKLTSAPRTVAILLAPTPAAAEMGIDCMLMAVAVMVRTLIEPNIVQIVIIAIDIDECAEGLDQCVQNCQNTMGSYMCSCNAGYVLRSDGRGCNGIYLFVVMRSS